MDGDIVLISAFSEFWQNRMPGRRHSDIGAEHGIVIHVDVRVVDQGQVKICKNIVAEMENRYDIFEKTKNKNVYFKFRN